MGFRFNKTFKQEQDPIKELLEHNPKIKYSIMKENMSLKQSFEEKNTSKIGLSIGKWKGIAIVAGFICSYIMYSAFVYSDPTQLEASMKKEKLEKEREKEALESE